jgi:AbrB family looped-hinge helix DNA binding protein
MEYTAGLTTRGRVTIPKAIRDQFGFQPYDQIHFTLEGGVVKLAKVSPSQDDTAGSETDADAATQDIRRLEP